MPQVLRKVPPIELVEQLFQACSLVNLQDSKWFSKTSVNLLQVELLLPILEPYYIPCKAKEFLHQKLTPIRAITILRHLCKAHDIHLTAAERTCAGVKGTWYQLTPTTAQSITIDFS